MDRDPRPLSGVVFGLSGALAAASIAGLAAFVRPQSAGALPSYAEKTGLSCGRCHSSPTGGALTSFGSAYAANGHKVPQKETKSGTEQAPDAAIAPATEVQPGRALDYVPWTLHDPYHSHFLYKADDYSD
jgi:hypothetical protein